MRWMSRSRSIPIDACHFDYLCFASFLVGLSLGVLSSIGYGLPPWCGQSPNVATLAGAWECVSLFVRSAARPTASATVATSDKAMRDHW